MSIKDNNQSDNLRALIDAGISSFKIEGRLKDLAYVKNITAHYRQLLDEILAERPDCRQSSSGYSHFLFTPQPEKTFNRGATDYFGRTANCPPTCRSARASTATATRNSYANWRENPPNAGFRCACA